MNAKTMLGRHFSWSNSSTSWTHVYSCYLWIKTMFWLLKQEQKMPFNVASWEKIKGAVCKNWPPVEIILQIYRGQHITSCTSLHSVDGFNGNSDLLHRLLEKCINTMCFWCILTRGDFFNNHDQLHRFHPSSTVSLALTGSHVFPL